MVTAGSAPEASLTAVQTGTSGFEGNIGNVALVGGAIAFDNATQINGTRGKISATSENKGIIGTIDVRGGIDPTNEAANLLGFEATTQGGAINLTLKSNTGSGNLGNASLTSNGGAITLTTDGDKDGKFGDLTLAVPAQTARRRGPTRAVGPEQDGLDVARPDVDADGVPVSSLERERQAQASDSWLEPASSTIG